MTPRGPLPIDRPGLAQFVLTTMEGGVMQARTHRSLAAYDASVAQLRAYIDLLRAAALARRDPLPEKEG